MVTVTNWRGAWQGGWLPERAFNKVTDIQLGISSPVVTIDEVKGYIKIESTTSDEDAFLTALIPSCQARIEQYCGVSLSSRTIKANVCNAKGNIEIPFGPLLSITSITDGCYFDGSFDDSFATGTDLTDQMILEGISFVRLREPRLNSINLVYTAGYDDGNTPLPPDLKQALMLEIAFQYRFRSPGTELRANVNPGLCEAALIYAQPHKRTRFY